jgi:hypothetical protein
MRYYASVRGSLAISAAVFGLVAAGGDVDAAKCPCDLFKDGGTPCVAAHSVVRALYETYDGALYQVKRKSDNKTIDVKVLKPGGYANAAVVDSFLKGTTGTVSIIYDQSERKNHLTYAVWGSAPRGPLKEAPANRVKDTISGHPVYPLATEPGEGYRNNKTSGVATGNQAEGMYMVCSGTYVNSGCCWDYGNAESDAEAGGKPTGAMEALYFGTSCWFKPCNGNGPWMFADLEWGLFQGTATNGTTNTSLPFEYVSGFLKGDIGTYTIRANNATLDVLKLMGSSNRPSAWVTNLLTGAIILGIGGDSSPSGRGKFFEGAMTIGRPTDAAEDAVQKNISLVYSHKDTIPSTGVHGGTAGNHRSPTPVVRYTGAAGASVGYVLQEAGRVTLTVIDQHGRRIADISEGVKPAGNHEVAWNAARLPAGVYIWKLMVDGKCSMSGKIVSGQ